MKGPHWDFVFDKLIVTWRIEAQRMMDSAAETDRQKRLTRWEQAEMRGRASTMTECSDRLEIVVHRLRYGKMSII